MGNSTIRGRNVISGKEEPWFRQDDERTEFLRISRLILKCEEYKLYCEVFKLENPRDENNIKGFMIWKIVGGAFEKECFKK